MSKLRIQPNRWCWCSAHCITVISCMYYNYTHSWRSWTHFFISFMSSVVSWVMFFSAGMQYSFSQNCKVFHDDFYGDLHRKVVCELLLCLDHMKVVLWLSWEIFTVTESMHVHVMQGCVWCGNVWCLDCMFISMLSMTIYKPVHSGWLLQSRVIVARGAFQKVWWFRRNYRSLRWLIT